MNAPVPGSAEAQAAFERLLGTERAKLHRYCARMTGSVIDGEDVVQDAMVKALVAFPQAGPIASPQGWLFRIAHNAALDFLRRRTRLEALQADEDPEMVADPADAAEQRLVAAASLHTFMRLPVAQRSSVILMDVLGYSLREIAALLDSSVPAVKAALHRGRNRLRELADEPDMRPPPLLTEPERSLLGRYIERFNARDFAAVRAMLAEEVRLDLVNRGGLTGRAQVGRYFHNYSLVRDWRLAPGFVERRPAILVSDPADAARPRYFILLGWAGDQLANIRDFRHASYVIADAELLPLD